MAAQTSMFPRQREITALLEDVFYAVHAQVLYEGADKSFGFVKKKKQAMGLKKCIYIFPPELHTLMACCSNFFNPYKKNSFGCAANRKIVNGKSQRLTSTPT
jgi:hypothetical protein